MNDEIVRIVFTDEIDLHHFHPRDAREILVDFLDHAEAEGYATVRIIHGKGRSVIKEMVRSELSRRDRIQRYADDAANWGVTVAWFKTTGG